MWDMARGWHRFLRPEFIQFEEPSLKKKMQNYKYKNKYKILEGTLSGDVSEYFASLLLRNIPVNIGI